MIPICLRCSALCSWRQIRFRPKTRILGIIIITAILLYLQHPPTTINIECVTTIRRGGCGRPAERAEGEHGSVTDYVHGVRARIDGQELLPFLSH